MISYLAFVLRGMGDHQDAEGQALVLAALRILQDCPSMAIAARKVRRHYTLGVHELTIQYLQ